MSELFMAPSMAAKQSKTHTTPVNPIISSNHTFEVPAKLIRNPTDMKIWEKSEAYFEYVGFILAINEAIKGKSNSQGSKDASEEVVKVVTMLDKLDAIIDETPPIQQPQRFGNQAFKTWFQSMRNDSMHLLQDVIKPELNKALPEIVAYLVDSFGNSTRIDYGTETDKVATGCYIFPRYLDLARKLQKTYRMEPAGSHGVWSLDDFQFIPFIWGSSQLMAHPVIEPKAFLNEHILNDYGEDFMFLTCIQYINSVKTGPFAEHSNQLWSISGVSSWSKINGGLVKMYKAEVLSKFPVIQHMYFGSLLTLRPMEQCTGMMTPRHAMMSAPGGSLASSLSSSKNSSSRSSEARSGSSELLNHNMSTSTVSSESQEENKQTVEDTSKSSSGSDEIGSAIVDAADGHSASGQSEDSEKNDPESDRVSTAESVRFGSVEISNGEGYNRRQARRAM